MNAAVEAGRAGDAGRGFAVVADLVSALAMRAEEEAKRARGQLSITQSEIVTAVEAVGKVDIALAAIASDVGEVNRLLAGMASDNQAQSSAISEITASVSSMDRATQQNAAMVEETSAAARSLSQEVGNLAANAAKFNFERRTRMFPSPSSAAAVRERRLPSPCRLRRRAAPPPRRFRSPAAWPTPAHSPWPATTGPTSDGLAKTGRCRLARCQRLFLHQWREPTFSVVARTAATSISRRSKTVIGMTSPSGPQ